LSQRKNIYGGKFRLLTTYWHRFGVTHTFVDTTKSAADVEQAIGDKTKILLPGIRHPIRS